jgi:hypothetical protein
MSTTSVHKIDRVGQPISKFITLPEAARILGVPETRLRSLVTEGRMKAIEVNGEFAVSEASVNKQQKPAGTDIRKAKRQPITLPSDSGVLKEDLPEYKKYSHLNGVCIWLAEAGRKYNIPHQTIMRWVQKKFILILGKDSNKLLLNEQDVAYCAEIYRNANGRKWLFNIDGTPYKPRH